MKSSFPRRFKSSNCKVNFLFPLAFFIFQASSFIPSYVLLPAVAQITDAHKTEADRFLNQGFQQYQTSQFEAAITSWQQALQMYRAIKNRRSEGSALGNLGAAYYSLGNSTKTIEYSQQSLAIARELKDRRSQGSALGNLGAAYYSLGNYAQAIEYAQQSLAITREVKNRRSEGNALGNLGAAYHSLGNSTKTIEYAQQWLAVARELKDRRSEGSALGNLGAAYYSLGNYAQAIGYSQQSLAITREIKDRQGEGNSLNNLGHSFLKSGNLLFAEKALLSAVQVWESIRGDLGNNDTDKISIFERQAMSYRALLEVLIRQNKTTTALEIAERGRGRAFVELLAQRLSADSSNLPSEGLPLASAPTQSQIRQIAKMQNATLVQYSIIYESAQIQGKRSARESALYIWVIQPTGEITFRQMDLKRLWQKHNASLSNLVVGNQEFFAVRNRSSFGSTKVQLDLPTLHQLLIEPIAPFLPKDPNAHVIFIPQGSLFQVPFPALQDANGTYLIQKHTILTAPSIQVLALTRQQRQKLNSQKPGNALVLGNPAMPNVSLVPGDKLKPLSPLPGAEIEAKEIAPLLKTQAIIGAQGTKAAIVQKMPQASMIHLATHGLLDDVRGLGSAIALAPSGNDLTITHIFFYERRA
jgi:CHAT domain-containing protein